MTHYRMLDRAPSCAILHNRNELKIYQGNQVYLNDGDNFELRFFNPLPYKIGVEINFNGIKKGDGYLVLNPGQDLILDRFLDEQRKMIFETYTIDGNNEVAVKAAEQNGVINFNFYREIGNYNNQNEVMVNYNFPPKREKPIYNNTYVTNNYYTGKSGPSGASGNRGWSGSGGVVGVYGACGTPGLRGNKTKINTSYTSSSTSFTSPGVFSTETDLSFSQDYYIPCSSTLTSSSLDSLNISEPNPVETGRIEMGEISNQLLKNVNAQFQSTPFHSITFKLMPISTMNRTIGEVRQYCPECSYRIRKNSWQYCPQCGNKLD